MQVYSITSGKGGVGKTNLICNMALRFAELGKRVLLIDADLGLANVDIVMGLKPKATLADLFDGSAELTDLLVPGPGGVTVLPASSGVQEMAYLSDDQILLFMGALEELDRDFDILLVDTGAGIGKNVLYFNAAAQEVMVVSTPEPTSMTDAYAVMKVLAQRHDVKRFHLIVNMVPDRKTALRVYRHLTTVADTHLPDVVIDYLGHVLRDPAVSQAVVDRQLLLQSAPESPASGCIRELVDTLVTDSTDRPISGNMQFFWRRLLQPGV